MKKTSTLLFTSFLGLLIFNGCHSGNGPKETALKFLTAVQQMNYTEAQKYATDDSRNMLQALAAFQKMMPPSAQEKYRNEHFEITNVEINGDEADVTYTSNQDTTNKTLKLKKENGRWKVFFTKDSFMPDLNEEAAPDSVDTSLPPMDTTLSGDSTR